MFCISDILPSGLILLSVLLSAFLVQLYFWIRYSRILSIASSKSVKQDTENLVSPISVIVVVNASHIGWITGNMRELFVQDHPMYEVVVVNDCGGEELTMLLQTMCLEYPIMKFTEIYPDRKFCHTIKIAKLMGIKAATYENLVFAEPWTRPASPSWLRAIASGFGKGAEVVVGMSLPEKKRTWWNGLAGSYAMFSLIRASRAAIAGRPYRASRTNFGFSKNVFFSSGGYNYLTTGYGDNDLYLSSIAKRKNSTAVLSACSIMLRDLPDDFGSWFDDLRFSTAMFRHYRAGVKFSVFLYFLSLLLFYILVILAFVMFCGDCMLVILPASVLLLRQATVYSLYFAISRRLDFKGRLCAFILYDLISPLWELVLWFSRRFGIPSKY